MSRCWVMSEMLDCFVTPQAYGRGSTGLLIGIDGRLPRPVPHSGRLARNPPVQCEWIHGANY
ncbi:Unknown protein sequence [Pseudomonas amygdali pv. eriobotryae]|uniref:Uncharacterized protein n=1 Tax=Pseudomonas amygdali pv. eriobotryae TaxID=129137 RepID=A0A0N8REV9_PSEA0|nr:Unknown protein sequence [Pseudomonas amygdali pv. eriobotryae]GFZ73581.1 hypothetical protein PSE10C_43230 [Pseudomonas amygdali pv. eriobotryae]